jgi:hypothetical protein
MTATSDVNTAGREPHAVATNKIKSRKANATVVGLMWLPRNFNTPVAAAMPVTATKYPNASLLVNFNGIVKR